MFPASAGNAAFVIYSSLILFDLLLTACVMGCVLALMALGSNGQLRYALLAGLCLGLGVSAKGPVAAHSHRLPDPDVPALEATCFGRIHPSFSGRASVLWCCRPVQLFWRGFGPALYSTGSDFAHGLIWEQSTGRISDRHAEPMGARSISICCCRR